MTNRGPKPKREKVVWSSNLAYAVGLLVTDGSLSKDGRHIELTSIDREQLTNFMKCLGIRVKIGNKRSGFTGKKTTRIQFGDVTLYSFLLEIGLTPNKTKTIGQLNIPDRYFFDFLRGHYDGDGCFYSYWDPRWRSSFMYYISFVSASKRHIDWLQFSIARLVHVRGHVTKSSQFGSVYQLRYAKREGLILLQCLYKNKQAVALSRKKLKIRRALRIVGITLP